MYKSSGVQFTINLQEADSNPAWYTIVTKTNYEKKVAKDLQLGVKNASFKDDIIEVVVPIREVEETVKDKSGKTEKVVKAEKPFPSYIFVKARMTEEVWRYLRGVTGVSTILSVGGYLTTMSEQEIQRIKEYCGLLEKEEKAKKAEISKELEEYKKKLKDKVGAKAVIKGGIFDGYTGKISELDFQKGKVTVIMDNSAISIEVNITDIELL
jgi:transcriptional antiterminator NusG